MILMVESYLIHEHDHLILKLSENTKMYEKSHIFSLTTEMNTIRLCFMHLKIYLNDLYVPIY